MNDGNYLYGQLEKFQNGVETNNEQPKIEEEKAKFRNEWYNKSEVG